MTEKRTVKPVTAFTAADWQQAFEREVARACDLAKRLAAAEAARDCALCRLVHAAAHAGRATA